MGGMLVSGKDGILKALAERHFFSVAACLGQTAAALRDFRNFGRKPSRPARLADPTECRHISRAASALAIAFQRHMLLRPVRPNTARLFLMLGFRLGGADPSNDLQPVGSRCHTSQLLR